MRLWRPEGQTKPFPFIYYYLTVAVVASIGLFDAVYLSVSHYKVYTDIGYHSFCAVTRAINCDTVSQSPYSIFIGVPVPVWGILGYLFFLFLLCFAWPHKANKRRVWTLLLLISLGFSIYSIFLAAISTILIHSYCIMCILSYAVNFLLLYFVWITRKRFKAEPFFFALKRDFAFLAAYPKTSAIVLIGFSICVCALFLYFPEYWRFIPSGAEIDLPQGITENGHPWIGAENPELVIVEFTDYRCFQCKKMHYMLRRLIQEHPNAIRLVHRHFPMDHTINPIVKEPFHTGAAQLAVVSLAALEENKFWEMNDAVFGISKNVKGINIQDLAKKAGVSYETINNGIKDMRLWSELMKDIHAGLEHGLTGTPGYVINGQVYVGHVPAKVLHKYRK